MDISSEDLIIGGHSVRLQEDTGRVRDPCLMTIDMLPDDVLLEIFGFHQSVDKPLWSEQDTWHSLVHVCRRWRSLVFASPRRLNLRLAYRAHRPMLEVLDAWPVLPISLISIDNQSDLLWENTVAGLESEYSNRICEINVKSIADSRWERFAAAMQKPFPELTHLRVWMPNEVPVLPDSFMGGSAPCLRTLELTGIPSPSIPKLLLSANGLVLVTLFLWDNPDSRYFSPDVMATALAVLTRLESLHLLFRFPRSRPNPASRPLLPPTRFVLPALTKLVFRGIYEYLEDLLTRIDPPRLNYLGTTFFIMDLNFDVPQTHRLIGHAEKFKTFDHAEVSIYDSSIRLCLYPTTGAVERPRFDIRIICSEFYDQFSALCQVCSSSFPLMSTLEELQIKEDISSISLHWINDIENARWLELLHPFTAVKSLYLTSGIAQRFCNALQELSGERTTEVLPALRSLFVQGSSWKPVQEAMKSFITARQLSGHPVVVDRWKD